MDELLGLALVGDLEGVKRAGASNLELGGLLAVLLDGGSHDVLSAGELKEFLDVGEFSRHCL